MWTQSPPLSEKQIIDLIKEALSDHYHGVLTESVTLIIINQIINPAEITEQHIQWAEKSIAEMDAREAGEGPV